MPVPRRRRVSFSFAVVPLLVGLVATSCQPAGSGFVAPDPADHLDPRRCQACHETQYAEWSGSMHAYAAEDPVFLAMNARGQRETNGELGDFCVRCHAPIAVLTGATKDGLNLEDVDDRLKGVTCVFCHSVVDKTGEHNADLDIRLDGIMRGGIEDPMETSFHLSAYSPLHDRDDLSSSNLCGPCHDVVTPAGVHLERTYLEWSNTIYNRPVAEGGLTCAACHMPGRDEPATVLNGSPERRVHDHSMPGIDIALTEFPDRARQRNLVQTFLDTSLYAELCVEVTGGTVEITYTLENLASGHSFPSGAAQDRRVWAQIESFDATGTAFSMGNVDAETSMDSAREADPNFWSIGDRMLDDGGQEVHMFWEAAEVESDLLPAPGPSTGPPGSVALHRGRTWIYAGLAPERVEATINVRPMGLNILRDLVDSGDLDEEVVARLPTFSLRAATVTWLANGPRCVPGGRLGGSQ